ncbi:transcriptional regulator, LysR family [Cribrihabitans marinus]|uniref:Transcriptional regulator, LysR family n=1 Tax=Cribrihabitans marinus TaxID=1227549 RepID=A0A1H6XHG2_9RHOB|nr:LysR family transcriptional regulator [Cribrihabitans marinus]GGH27399.1 LysR family transcriptional regulator [Cribrihabitans marinus]SEJ28561.1 transcriptional regulator, LysR family [Cribrihabitans marinus]
MAKRGLPPLDWLRVFEAAGRLGGFSSAAREFGLTQAAVSQRIANLEAWLGRPLFVREARGVSLTMDGEAYLPLVQEGIGSLQRSTEDLFGTAPRELRIAGMTSHIHALLLPRLGAFLQAHPDLRVLTEALSQRLDFDDQTTWLQIRFERGGWPGRTARRICREILAPMAAPGVGWGAPLIELRGSRPGWQVWAQEIGMELDWHAGLSVDSMEHALTAARLGQGVVLGSLALAREALADGRLVRLDLPELQTEDSYWLTWPDGRLAARRMRALVEALLDELVRGQE